VQVGSLHEVLHEVFLHGLKVLAPEQILQLLATVLCHRFLLVGKFSLPLGRGCHGDFYPISTESANCELKVAI
jgi:hypothetical protein